MLKNVTLSEPKRKLPGAHRVGSGVPRGTPPRPPAEPEPVRRFDEYIESNGAELKRKHPDKAAQIDRTVAGFKERNKAGEFHDGTDTMFEFIDAALKPLPKPYKSGKSGPRKGF
jgi:hypothetical protein